MVASTGSKFGAQWLLDLPVSKKLAIVIGILAVIIVLELVMLWFGMQTLSAMRAFVGCEGLWSKAQKQAVINLNKYSVSHNDADYQEFLRNLKILLGDRSARLELEKKKPNYALARQGLLEGRTDPRDIKDMLTYYKRFHSSLHKRAREIAMRAFIILDEFQLEASKLHQLVVSGHTSENEMKAARDRIEAINDRFIVLEDNYSYTIGEASRWVNKVVFWAIVGITLTIGSLGLIVAIFLAKTISNGINEIKNGAIKVTQGNFEYKVPVISRDEIGHLGNSFNAMTASLSLARQQQKKIEQLKDDFVAFAAHQLKSPLAEIKGFLDNMLMGISGGISEKQKDYALKMRTIIDRNLRLVSDLLSVSQIEQNIIAPNIEPIELNEIVHYALRDYIEVIRKNGLSLQVKGDGTLVLADAQQAVEAVRNVIENSIKFTENGRITIETGSENGYGTIEVHDTGPGIVGTLLPKLFTKELIFAGPRPKGGSGLGLYISNSFMKLQKGTITVDSTVGKGTRFVFRFRKSTK